MNRLESPPWRPGAVAEQGGSRTRDLRHYGGVLARYWWVLVGAMVLGGALALFYVVSAEPVYRASASLVIEQKQTNVVSIDELIGVETEAPDYYKTQFAMLRSRALAKRVIAELDLWDHPELSAPDGDEATGLLDRLRAAAATVRAELPAPASGREGEGAAASAAESAEDELRSEGFVRERVVSEFLRRLTISPLAETKLVRIRYDSGDPAFAARIANAVGEQYITSYLDSKLSRTERAATWLSSRVADLKITLEASEQRLLAFKRDNGLIDVDGNIGKLDEQELLLATSELALAQRDVTELRDLRRRIDSFEGDTDLLMSIGRIQQDALVQRARVDEERVRQELEELGTRYGPRHPNVLDARSRLETITAGIGEQVQRVAGIIDSEYRAAQQRLAEIESRLQLGKDEVQALGEQRLALDALEREVATNLQIYQTFYNRLIESRSADGLDSANASLFDRAVPPERPIKPRPVFVLGSALFLSLALAGIAILLRDQLDRSINEPADVEDELGYAVLGSLPLIGTRGRRRREGLLVPDRVRDGMFVENVNAIRTTLDLTGGPDRSGAVVLVTSSVPGEGKSSVSVNLAHSFGRRERVLLIDADLRRPALSAAIPDRRSSTARAGLSDLAGGEVTTSEAIQRDGVSPGVDFLSSGSVPAHPLELLSSDRMERIVTALGKIYDRIVIDSPPVRAVADPLVLGRYCDVVIYVVKAHDTDADIVRSGLRRFESVGIDVAGVVITQIDSRKTRSHRGDRYYSAYHDLRSNSDERPPVWMRARKGSRSGSARRESSVAQAEQDDFDRTREFDSTTLRDIL